MNAQKPEPVRINLQSAEPTATLGFIEGFERPRFDSLATRHDVARMFVRTGVGHGEAFCPKSVVPKVDTTTGRKLAGRQWPLPMRGRQAPA